MRLFIYGTLKRGGSNHDYLKGQQFIGTAVTRSHYRLYDIGGYPGMRLVDQDGLAIEGEIWDVDDAALARLDDLEDISAGEYVRELVPLQPPWESSSVEGYRYLWSVAGKKDIGANWEIVGE